jgi:hypothetical protein
MNTKLRLAALVLVLAIQSSPLLAQPIDVTARFGPPTQTVNVGDFFTVDIMADINHPIVGWGLDFVIANQTVLSQSAVPSIGPSWFPSFAQDGDGLAGLAFPTSISGSGIRLATLQLHADAVGDTNLLLSITPGDLSEGFALDPTGFATTTFELGHITVTPEPAAAMLILIAGVLTFRRLGLRRD